MTVEPPIPPGGTPSPGPSNLRLRVVSGLVMALAVLALTWFGGLAFRLFAGLLGLAIIHEWLTMTGRGERDRHYWTLMLLVGGVVAAMVVGAAATVLLALLLVAVAVALIDSSLGRKGYWPPLGVLYAGLAALSLAFLRGEDDAGLWAILFLFAVVWLTDIAAYFTGRAIGGPKLVPSISPNKTWSGAIGGTVCGAAVAMLVVLASGTSGDPMILLLVAVGLSVVAQLGDLFESVLKRRHSVKDSGTLIPGHGGVMDRVDGLVAAAIAFYVLCALLAGPERPATAFFLP